MKEKIILILDVESSAVRGFLIIKGQSEIPRIIFSHNEPIPWKPHTDSTYLIKTTEKAIRETISVALRQLYIFSNNNDSIPKKISSVHYTLSSPWLVSQAKLISTTFEKETKIDHDYILKLIESERTKLSPSQSEPVKIFEEKIFDVRLNGYSVNNWQNKLARSLDISFTASIAGTNTIDRFMALCDHAVSSKRIYFHSSLLLQFMGVEQSMHINSEYTLIHIHGELTDLATIRDQSCIFFGSYPFGTHTLIRKVAASTKTNQQTADSLVTLYTGDHLDQSQNKDSISVVQTISEGWAKELSKIYTSSNYKIESSGTIVLSTPQHEDTFAKILGKIYPKIKISLVSETELLLLAINSME